MVETLSFIGIGVVLLLAVSMLLPTRRLKPVVIESNSAVTQVKEADDAAHGVLLDSLTLLLCQRNHQRDFSVLDFEQADEQNPIQIAGDVRDRNIAALVRKSREVLPKSWFDMRCGALRQSQLLQLCHDGEIAKQICWNLIAIDFGESGKDAGQESISSELKFRHIVQGWFASLDPMGFTASYQSKSILWAVPTNRALQSCEAVSLIKSLQLKLVASAAAKDAAKPDIRFLLISTESGSQVSAAIEELTRRFDDPQSAGHNEQYSQAQWVRIDEHVEDQTKQPSVAAYAIAEDVSTDEIDLSQNDFVEAKPKTTFNRASDVDMAKDVVTGEDIADLFDRAKDRDASIQDELGRAEQSTQADLDEIKQSVDSAKKTTDPSKSSADQPDIENAEDEAVVTAEDIESLFAAASA